MSQSAEFSEYLKTVCNQVHWQRSHNVISKELLNHLEDQKSAFLAQGMNESEAEKQAVREMGDPAFVGAELNAAYRPKTDWNLIILIVIILAAGLCSRLMLAGPQSNFSIADTLIGLIGGVIALLSACFMDFSMISRYAGKLFAIFVVLLTGVLAYSYIVQHGRPSFAPYLLILFPVLFAGLVYRQKGKGISGLVISELSAALVLALGLFSHSIAAVFIAGTSVLIILTYVVAKGWFGRKKLIGLSVVYIPVIISAAVAFGQIYVSRRLTVLLNPFVDPNGAGYMGVTTRKILENAHPIGNSAGTDIRLFLPNPNSQYLLTLIIQRVGWIALAAVLLLFILFILHGIRLCQKQESQFCRLFCISILASFGLQCFCFIVSNLGFISTSEFPMPLISGKISMILNLFLLGLMMSVFRSGRLFVDRMDSGKESRRFFFEDGKLIISLK